MEDFILYKRRRDNGLNLVLDENNISSECNEIFFVNLGDWPFYAYRVGSNVKRLVNPGVEISFGESSRPDTIESDVFAVEFTGVGTVKSCGVERVTYEKISKCEPNRASE